MFEKSLSWDQFVILDRDLENNYDFQYDNKYDIQYESILNKDNVNFKINNSYEPYTYWGDIIAKTAFIGWLVYILFVV